ncbi:zf-HC2 domain-containing protein [Streptomyces sp. PRKS01-29]|nr:zf-HC2 domain-containing protein [Streptomyces sabulosicollis]MBI0294707.1 zf-HC2 domain-containing protein [Streptomyces sabulosicollis]
MLCSRIRTAVSARLDGEGLPPGITTEQLAAHLEACAACRLWETRARQLTEHIARLREADTTPTPGGEAPRRPRQAL